MSDADQRSEQWFKDRAGKITASMFGDAISMNEKNKNKIVPSAARMKYMRQLAFERLAGIPKHQIDARSLSYGREVEDSAREMYEIRTGFFADQVGFIVHPSYPFIGCSADSFVGDDGGLEIKCPHDEAVHVQTLLEGMPEDHIDQVQGCMFVTGRQWWDFVSFDPRQAPKYRLYIERIFRNQEYIASLEIKLLQFEMELQQMIKNIEMRVAA